MKAKRPRWQFTWCDEGSPPTGGDEHAWKSKTFWVSTFESAMDKMLCFVQSKPFVCLVDYECRAAHVPYRTDGSNHDEAFRRIDRTEHELTEYVR